MGRRKLVVALVGAIGLSLLVTPADALTSPVVADQAQVGRLVVRSCSPPVTGAIRLALHSAGKALVAHGLAAHHGLHRLRASAAADVEVAAVNTALGGSAAAVASTGRADEVDVTAVNTGTAGTAVAVASTWRADEVDVTAVNTAPLGTAVAVADVHRAHDVDVTAVNTGALGTAVAVAAPAAAPAKSTKGTTSNVTAVNTGILGQAVAVGGGGSGDVTAINTGILGSAVAVGGGANVGYPLGL